MLSSSTPSSSHTLTGTREIITPSMIVAAYVIVYSRGEFLSARDRYLIRIVSAASTVYSRVRCCKVYVFASEKDGGLCKELVNGRV